MSAMGETHRHIMSICASPVRAKYITPQLRPFRALYLMHYSDGFHPSLLYFALIRAINDNVANPSDSHFQRVAVWQYLTSLFF